MENEVRVHTIARLSDYLDMINKLDYKFESETLKISKGCIFRGHHSPEWKLWSKLERSLDLTYIQSESRKNLKKLNGQKSYDDKCKELIQRFRFYSGQLNNNFENKSDEELFSIGRHYGLLTPYLDWTENPYIATFFAFYELYKKLEYKDSIPTMFKDGFVTVWRLNLIPELFNDDFQLKVFNSKIGERLNAQRGLFTFLKTSEYSDVESYLKSRNLLSCLERYNIPYELFRECIVHLDNMNINIFSVYPDLTGAAEQSNIEIELLHTFHTASDAYNSLI